MSEEKPIVSKQETFDLLEIRTGKIIELEDVDVFDKKAYKIKIDFGKFGIKQSIGRFTNHTKEELLGKIILAVLNFGEKKVGDYTSDVLVLGVQYPQKESGEATIITPIINSKIGKKLF
ncbi:MAG: hypothetical protein JXA94_01270 [Parachlamydiales bacterium]|nr:hypothetical protein [Parachlamydiales bacterium]